MKLKFIVTGVFFLILFSIFTVLVGKDVLDSLDLKSTIYLQRVVPKLFEYPFSMLSLVGSVEMVAVIILSLWFITRKLNIIFVLFGMVGFHLVELIGKVFLEHPGPSSKFFKYIFDFSFPTSSINPGSSYPSGHVGRTVFLSVLFIYLIHNSKRLTDLKKNILYIFILSIAIFMFISRIYLGEHWTTDVFGGALAGLSFSILTLAFWKRPSNRA